MNRGGGGGAERSGEEAEGLMGGGIQGAMGHVRGIVQRWPDADAVLQGSISEALRDWDLWWVHTAMESNYLEGSAHANMRHRGPLLFCLLLSFLLSINARQDQRSLVFSGVFATIWLGEAIVTLQIKLLGGNMYVSRDIEPILYTLLIKSQLLLPIHLHHRLHSVPASHCLPPLRNRHTDHRTDTGLRSPRPLVTSSRCEHPGWKWSGQEQGGTGRVPSFRVLCGTGLSLLHLVAR